MNMISFETKLLIVPLTVREAGWLGESLCERNADQYWCEFGVTNRAAALNIANPRMLRRIII